MITALHGILSSGNETPKFIFTVSVQENDTITIPHSDDPSYVHDYDIDYGDGTPILHVTSYNDINATHIYSTSGDYQIKIVGLCESFIMDKGDILAPKLISVDSWGGVWKS